MRVAFIYPFSVRNEEFFSDVLLSLCSGDVKRAGHDSQVFKVYYDRDDAAATARTRARLVDELFYGDYDLIVYEWLWDLGEIRQLRERSRKSPAVAVLDPIAPRDVKEIDFLVAQNFRATLEKIVAGGDPTTIPGLWSRKNGDGSPLIQNTPAEPEGDDFADYRPDFDHRIVNDDFRPAGARKTLHGAAGCPYAKSVERNRFFAQTDVSAQGVSKLGCAFCHMGGDYQVLERQAHVDRLLNQAELLQARFPEIRELVIRDNHVVPLLPWLLKESLRRRLRPVEYLFITRPGWLLGEQETLREACRVAQGTGFSLHCYLIGFENFSQRELDRYNKGESVDTLLRAAELLRSLEHEFPDTFDRGRYRTHSLILFNPWTELDDLQTNVKTLRTHALGDLFCTLSLRKLRLYENLPLYHTAVKDDLVLDVQESPRRDNAALFGYTAEIPWRFAHDRVSRVYDLASELIHEAGNDHEFAMLQSVLALVRRRPDIDVAAVVRDVNAFRKRLEQYAVPEGPDSLEISVDGPCNNHCAVCPNHDRTGTDVLRVLKRAKRTRHLIVSGREPTLRADLTDIVRQARQTGFTSIALVTNGRRLSYAPYAQALRDAGLTHVTVKLFGADSAIADAITQTPGSHAQGLLGLGVAAKTAGLQCSARLVVTDSSRMGLPAMVALAASAGATHVEFDFPLDGIALDTLPDLTPALTAGLTAAARLGLRATCRSIHALWRPQS